MAILLHWISIKRWTQRYLSIAMSVTTLSSHKMAFTQNIKCFMRSLIIVLIYQLSLLSSKTVSVLCEHWSTLKLHTNLFILIKKINTFLKTKKFNKFQFWYILKFSDLISKVLWIIFRIRHDFYPWYFFVMYITWQIFFGFYSRKWAPVIFLCSLWMTENFSLKLHYINVSPSHDSHNHLVQYPTYNIHYTSRTLSPTQNISLCGLYIRPVHNLKHTCFYR